MTNSWKDIGKLVKKNIKVLIRSKASSLIIILGPLLIIFLAGIAFDNTNSYALKLGLYSPSENEILTTFREQLDSQFTTISFSDEQKCIDSIKNDEVHACIVFSENFALAQPPNNEIKFYVDYSKINLVWTVLDVMTSEIDDKVMQLSKNLTGILLKTLDIIQKEVGDKRSVIVRLTTENDIINRNSANLAADLGDIDLTFDPAEFKVDDVKSRLNKVKHWVDTALKLGKEGLQKASTFIDSAGDIGGDSVTDSLRQSIDKIAEIKGRLAKTEELSSQEFTEFTNTINALVLQISDTKSQLNKADTSRQVSVRVLNAVRNLLDESLINLLNIQKSFNTIQNAIDDIEIKNTEGITQPIVTNIKPVSAKQSYLNYLFPALIIVVLMFTALLIVPTLILLEKNSPAFFRNFMTPVNDIYFFISTLFTSLIILAVQSLIILSITSLFFSTQISSNIFSVLLILFLTILFFSFLGMIIGYLFKTEETAILGGVTASFILIFVSNLIIPIESMPAIISAIANLNPFVIASDLLRRSLLFDSGFSLRLLLFFGYVIVAGLIAFIVFLTTKKTSMRYLIKKLAPVIKYVRRRSV